jgi:hypothetical protein
LVGCYAKNEVNLRANFLETVSNKAALVVVKSLAGLFLLNSAIAHAERPRGTVLKPTDQVFAVENSGKTISCVRSQDGKIVAGSTSRDGSRFISDRAVFASKASKAREKIKELRSDGDQQRRIRKLQARLRLIRASVSQNNQSCASGSNPIPQPTPVPPVQDGFCDLSPQEGVATREQLLLLLSRGGFGLGVQEEGVYDTGLSDGISAAVDRFMQDTPEDAATLYEILDLRDGALGNQDDVIRGGDNFYDLTGIRRAWLKRFVSTPNAYREKLAFFLYGIWTAGHEVVPNQTQFVVMWDYIELLRKHARTGDLRQLAYEVSTSPLMLHYLDGNGSKASNPNENFGREIMELFTLGPVDDQGNTNYTELGDIPEISKAFTGWFVERHDTQNQFIPGVTDRGFRGGFRPADFSPGQKILFAGKSYEAKVVTHTDAIDALFNHPHIAKYYAKEILREYVTRQPPQCLIDGFASILKENRFNLEQPMKTLLKSKAFYHPSYRLGTVKNGLEAVMQFVRSSQIPVDTGRLRLDMDTLVGMNITSPPSVFWWPDETWLAPPTVLGISNTITRVIGNLDHQNSLPWSPLSVCPASPTVNSSDLIAHVFVRMGLEVPKNEEMGQLQFYIENSRNLSGQFSKLPYDNTNVIHQRRKCLGLYYAAALMPEFLAK